MPRGELWISIPTICSSFRILQLRHWQLHPSLLTPQSLESSLTPLSRPQPQQILLNLPSKYIWGLTISHSLHSYLSRPLPSVTWTTCSSLLPCFPAFTCPRPSKTFLPNCSQSDFEFLIRSCPFSIQNTSLVSFFTQ